jgi:hypothetical protein
VTTYRRRLPGTYGVLTVAETTDHDAATVTYRIRAPHVTGTIVARPDWTAGREHQALPDGVEFQFGTGPRYQIRDDRADRPQIYGVTLVGAFRADPIDFLTSPHAWFRFHRSTGRHTSCAVPDRTNALALAVMTQLLILWMARTDRADLVRTHGRRAAPARLGQLLHGPIVNAENRIETQQRELDRNRAYAAELEILAAEHAARPATETE